MPPLAEFARRDFGPRADLLAGLTVAAYLIPQCLAYGELAGLEPIQGLWASLPPLLLYALIGSSPQLSVGPESTTALLTAAAIAPLAAGDPATAATLAALLALLVAVVCGAAYLARLGFLADLLSRPILVGYMAGVALIMVTSQARQLLGLPTLHGPTAALGLGVLLFLLIGQRLAPRAPAPLLAVLLAVAVVALARLDQHGVAVIGAIPAGLPRFGMPSGVSLEAFKRLLVAAVGIAVVGYSDNVLTARAFAARGGYRIDADRELLALAVMNGANGLLQGFPVSSSGSRTALGDAMGSRSQRFSLVALGVVVLVLVALRPLLMLFPRAALAAVVIAAALRLIDLGEFERMRRFKRSEFQLALITTAGVLLTDILTGVALAVALSVIDLFARLMRPHDAVMGQVPQLAGLHDVSDWEGATTIPGLLIYRYDAPLCFANAEHFLRRALAAVEQEPIRPQWFVLNAEAIVEIDITAADALLELQATLAKQGVVFAFARVKQGLYQQLSRAGVVALVGADHFFPTLPTAVAAFHGRSAKLES
jgi:high affinity sulfate transporter 1